MIFSFELFIIFFIFAWIDLEFGILPALLTFSTFYLYLFFYGVSFQLFMYLILCIVLYFVLKGKHFGSADIPLFAFIPLYNPIMFIFFILISIIYDKAYVSAFISYLICFIIGGI